MLYKFYTTAGKNHVSLQAVDTRPGNETSMSGNETSTSTEPPPGAEEDWSLLDTELMEEMMEKQKSNAGYRKMLVSEFHAAVDLLI